MQYTATLVHAVDGLGHGLILMPINGNLILKIYDETKDNPSTESYSDCILPLAEIRDLMETEVRSWGRKD